MLGAPGTAAWKTIVPERKEAIESVGFIGGRIVAQYLVDVQSRLSLFEPDGAAARRRRAARAPAPWAASADATMRRTSGTRSPRRWRPPRFTGSTPRAGSRAPRSRRPTPPVDASAYETLALFATSKDGTRVPLFVTAKKGLARDGNNPTMVYGYGGFAVEHAAGLPARRARRGSSAAASG